ncbi:MAG: hypothetical protein OEO21_00750 [Candidatus Krumholzibacteria bacterium]|nr:hypothetical protein [Candidatus Krumholzibacteria bacterium]
MVRRNIIMVLVALGLFVPVLVGAQTQVVALGSAQLTTITPEDTTEGKVFVLAVSVPQAPAGARLMSAMMELVVDASSALPAAAPSHVVTLEIFPLAGALSGLAVESVDLRPTTMKRSVPVGTNQRVRMDVTEFVEYVLANPEENYGIAVGSLAGSRPGRFELKSQGQDVATLTIRYLPADLQP